MRWWRVVRWIEDASPGSPGHPDFVPTQFQGGGRFDNPRWYTAAYLAADPHGAVGETFGNLATWTSTMLHPGTPAGSVMALASFELADPRLVDLDDAQTLLDLGLKPSDVVRRNRDKTRQLALRLFLTDEHDGISWWSYHDPEWINVVVWAGHDDDGTPTSPLAGVPFEVEPLALDHPGLLVAADALARVIRH